MPCQITAVIVRSGTGLRLRCTKRSAGRLSWLSIMLMQTASMCLISELEGVHCPCGALDCPCGATDQCQGDQTLYRLPPRVRCG